DEYFLSKEWGPIPPGVTACCMRLEMRPDLQQPAIRLAVARVTLAPDELQQFRRLKGGDRESNDWLYRRIAAKDAVRTLWWKEHGERLFPADIELEPEGPAHFAARRRGLANAPVFARATAARTETMIAGLAVFEGSLGLAVQQVAPLPPAEEAQVFAAIERQ